MNNLLPPGVNAVAVNKHIYIYIYTSVSMSIHLYLCLNLSLFSPDLALLAVTGHMTKLLFPITF